MGSFPPPLPAHPQQEGQCQGSEGGLQPLLPAEEMLGCSLELSWGSHAGNVPCAIEGRDQRCEEHGREEAAPSSAVQEQLPGFFGK